MTRACTSARISSLFFLLIPPPPRSTLFPYTTLFRSRLDLFPAELLAEQRSGGFVGEGRGQLADRKSTRLNSSHRCISYAVFCLKKKNKTSPTRWLTTPLPL